MSTVRRFAVATTLCFPQIATTASSSFRSTSGIWILPVSCCLPILALFNFNSVLELTVRGDFENTDDSGGGKSEPDVLFDPYEPTIFASYPLTPLPVHMAEQGGLRDGLLKEHYRYLSPQVNSHSDACSSRRASPIIHRGQAYGMVLYWLRLSGVWNHPVANVDWVPDCVATYNTCQYYWLM